MTRYERMFARCGEAGEGTFGAFLMLGDPDLATSATLLDAAVAGGADMIEVGIPFSDPIADGPVIQAAAERALAAGVRTADCFDLIAGFRARHPQIPLGILTYANLVVARGRRQFAEDAAAAGADSLLIADVPAFEARPFAEAARAAGLAPVLIAAANTPLETISRIAKLGAGYTYCVARAGVTGMSAENSQDHAPLVAALAEAGAPPSILGFGISTPGQVEHALCSGAAGVICGSAIVRLAAESTDSVASVALFIATMKNATRGCSK